MPKNQFLSLIPVGSIGAENDQQEAAALVKRMCASVVPHLNKMLWSDWGKVDKFARCSTKPIEDRFDEFIREHFFVS